MADFEIKLLSPEDKKALEEKKSAGSAWHLLIAICIILAILALAFFLWNQPKWYFEEKKLSF